LELLIADFSKAATLIPGFLQSAVQHKGTPRFAKHRQLLQFVGFVAN